MKSRLVSVALVAVIIALIALIGMLAMQRGVEVSSPPPVSLSQGDRDEAERIIRARINSLSPTPPMLGGTFDVDAIEWDTRGAARVTYGDGESMFEGTATVETGSGRVKISGFEMKE